MHTPNSWRSSFDAASQSCQSLKSRGRMVPRNCWHRGLPRPQKMKIVCVKEELRSRCCSGSLLVVFFNVSSQVHRLTKSTPRVVLKDLPSKMSHPNSKCAKRSHAHTHTHISRTRCIILYCAKQTKHSQRTRETESVVLLPKTPPPGTTPSRSRGPRRKTGHHEMRHCSQKPFCRAVCAAGGTAIEGCADPKLCAYSSPQQKKGFLRCTVASQDEKFTWVYSCTVSQTKRGLSKKS